MVPRWHSPRLSVQQLAGLNPNRVQQAAALNVLGLFSSGLMGCSTEIDPAQNRSAEIRIEAKMDATNGNPFFLPLLIRQITLSLLLKLKRAAFPSRRARRA